MKSQRRGIVMFVSLFCQKGVLLLFFVFGLVEGFCQSVRIEPGGGDYGEGVTVRMSSTSGQTIRYSTNGSVPTGEDREYEGPITLTEACFSRSNIYRIKSCPDVNWRTCERVDHVVVLRAALFNSIGERCSEVNTEVYVIDKLLNRRIMLPVISLSIDSSDLFDYDSGIYVPGRHYDAENEYHSGNYCEKGEAWERKANLSMIKDGRVEVDQECGVRIHGNRTRSYMQKGFTLYARQQYGNKYFNYRFFGSGGKSRYKRLVLRPWLASWNGTGIEDWLAQHLAEGLNVDALETCPVVLFLNGEYWGIYFIEEKADERYVEDYYDFDKEDVDVLVDWGGQVENGSGEGWEELYRWLETADLRRDEDYDYLARRVDVDELLDYMLLQVFIQNVDWPANNVRQWSSRGSRWRWIFFDGDAAFNYWKDRNELFEYITCDDSSQTYPSSPRATLLFRRLLAREEFLYRSIGRLTTLVHYCLGERVSEPLLDKIVREVEGEVKYQSLRFGSPESVSDWNGLIRHVYKFLRERSESVVEGYASWLGVEKVDMEAEIFPNPSFGVAQLVCDTPFGGVMEMEVFDVMGRCLEKKTVDLEQGSNRIPLPALSRGIYLVRLSGVGRCLKWVVR